METKILEVLDKIDEDIRNYDGENLFDAGLLDSFLLIELVGLLEEEFDIEIDAELVIQDNFKSIKAIMELVNSVQKP